MQIPSLPTDNLYKFMAIGGIVLFLAGHFASWSGGTRIQELHAQVEQAKAISRIYAKTDSQKAELALAEVAGAEYEIRFIEDQRWGVRAFLNFTFWVGSLLSLAGFILWYIRVQRQLDILLLEEIRRVRGQVE